MQQLVSVATSFMLSFHFTSLAKVCELWHVQYNDKVYIAVVKLILKMIPGSSEHE